MSFKLSSNHYLNRRHIVIILLYLILDYSFVQKPTTDSKNYAMVRI